MTRNGTMAIAALLAAGVVGVGTGVAVLEGTDRTGGTTTVYRSQPSRPRPAANLAATGLSVNEIYRRTRRSVVEVTVSSRSGGLDFPFGGGSGRTQAQGSGFIHGDSSHVVTNQHVVDGAQLVTVTYSDGTTTSARVVGADASTDLAVLELRSPKTDVEPLTLGDSGALRVGDGVVAIGSPFGLEGTVTSGIVSALHREIDAPDNAAIEDAVQTDAAINHGNSGGPLLNSQGRVVGVNAQIDSDSGGSVGVGFAIPSATLQRVAPQLLAGKRVDHALLGVRVAKVSAGVRVEQVESGSGASKAKLRKGDVISRAGGTSIRTPQDLRRAVAARVPGDELRLTVRRSGRTLAVTATLGSRSA